MSSLADLEKTLSTKSYLSGYACSKEDVDAVNKFGIPDKTKFPNTYRWSIHVVALVGIDACGVAGAAPAPAGKAAKATKADDDDDLDLFGDDDEEDAGPTKEEIMAAKKAKGAAAKAAYDAKKAAQAPKTFRSLVALEVKPWEADTDLVMVWNKIKEYKQEGLVWGESHKLEPVAFGIKKLVMTCVIDDDKVLMDDITDGIEALEDYVQSVQVCSMNKL